MAKIVVSSGARILRELELDKERVTIGRGPSNDLVLDDLAISGTHAMIVVARDGSYIEDLNSTNGTQINGQPFKKHFLRHDDVVTLAHYQLHFLEDEQASIHAHLPPGSERQKPAVASLCILNGPMAGREIKVKETLTTIGRPGIGVAGLICEGGGYRISHVEGKIRPLINDAAIEGGSCAVADGDVLDIAGVRMRFSFG